MSIFESPGTGQDRAVKVRGKSRLYLDRRSCWVICFWHSFGTDLADLSPGCVISEEEREQWEEGREGRTGDAAEGLGPTYVLGHKAQQTFSGRSKHAKTD